jgi:alpha-L-rhamnosidase
MKKIGMLFICGLVASNLPADPIDEVDFSGSSENSLAVGICDNNLSRGGASAVVNLRPTALRCEHLVNPLGIDVTSPRFSWELRSPERGQKQTACRILVAYSPEKLAANEAGIWDSGKLESGRSILTPYAGEALGPDTDCYWKVMVWDRDGKPSEWSEPARFSIGLLGEDDWKGEWIEFPAGNPKRSCPQYRKTFTLDQPASRAFVYVASLGYHELYINGKKADDRALAPAHSVLGRRVLYVAYDVADLLRKGENVIAVWHGPGFATHDGAMPAIRVQANILTDGGSAVSVATDASWKCAESAHRIFFRKEVGFKRYGGEEIDARKQNPDWNTVAFDDSAWINAGPTLRKILISAQMVEPDRIIRTFEPISIEEVGAKTYKVDFGTNFTGFLELRNLRGEPGQEILIQSADDPESEQDFDQVSRYLCGESPGTFRHRFNWTGCRYVRITGLDYEPQPDDIRGLAVSTDLERRGRFECSNDLLNRIYETDLWTFRANTVAGYTFDCPNREKRGYGEFVWASTWVMQNYRGGAGAFCAHTVRNWCDKQWDNGFIPHVAPNAGVHGGGLFWSIAPLSMGWEMLRFQGDERVVAQFYPNYRKWLGFLHSHASRSGEGILTEDMYESKSHASGWYFLGDWRAPGERREWRDSPEAALFNNCAYALSLGMMIDIAAALGREDDVSLYAGRLEQLREAIHAKFFNPEKNIYLDTFRQLHQAFPLLAGVVPEAVKPAVMANLKKDLTEAKDTTELLASSEGYSPTNSNVPSTRSKAPEKLLREINPEWTKPAPYLDIGCSLPALLQYLIEDAEWNDVLYGTINKTTFPGYGFFLEQGETTWPESWGSKCASRIHTCFPGIAAWFTKGIGGIRATPDQNGYPPSYIIKPHLVGDLSYADTSIPSPYGPIVSNWKRSGDEVKLHVEIPPNTTATVYVPGRDIETVTESGGPARDAEGVRFVRAENDRLVFEVESGTYGFVSKN